MPFSPLSVAANRQEAKGREQRSVGHGRPDRGAGAERGPQRVAQGLLPRPPSLSLPHGRTGKV